MHGARVCARVLSLHGCVRGRTRCGWVWIGVRTHACIVGDVVRARRDGQSAYEKNRKRLFVSIALVKLQLHVHEDILAAWEVGNVA
jgi:hypothetical protein